MIFSKSLDRQLALTPSTPPSIISNSAHPLRFSVVTGHLETATPLVGNNLPRLMNIGMVRQSLQFACPSWVSSSPFACLLATYTAHTFRVFFFGNAFGALTVFSNLSAVLFHPLGFILT